MENKKIKMVALDLDRTTLRDDKSLSFDVRDKLEKAISKGVAVVIATGRGRDSLPKEITSIKGIKYYICSNGAKVYDGGTFDVVSEKFVCPDAVREMVSIIKERGYMFESFTGGKAYAGRDYYELVRDDKIDYRAKDYMLSTRTPVDDIFSFTLDHVSRIENMNVFFPDHEAKEALYPRLSKIENAALTSSFPTNYELGPYGANKGSALEFLMEKEGIGKDELLAAGDSPNDISMIELAGTGIAMENAEEEVKEIADDIVPDSDHDGISVALVKYVL